MNPRSFKPPILAAQRINARLADAESPRRRPLPPGVERMGGTQLPLDTIDVGPIELRAEVLRTIEHTD
jgi:hypothetical protein